MNLANKLTVFRIILVPIILIFAYINIPVEIPANIMEPGCSIPLSMLIMEIIFIIASITDKLDGYIARSRNMVTTFGKFLDPLADKILVLTTLIILVEADKIPAWIPSIIMAREFLVSGYRLVAAQKGGQVIAASFWGKLKTVTQIIAIIIAFNDVHSFGSFIKYGFQFTRIGYIVNLFSTICMSLAVIATIFSGWDYLKNGKDLLFKED